MRSTPNERALGASGLVVAGVLLAACGAFSSDDSSPAPSPADGGSDAPTSTGPDGGIAADGGDAGRPGCPRDKPVDFFVDAFGSGTFAVEGVPQSVPTFNGLVVSTKFDAQVKPPTFWVRSSGDDYVLASELARPACALEARFALTWPAHDTGVEFAAVTIGLRAPTYDHCYAAVQVLKDRTMVLQRHCGKDAQNEYAYVPLGNVPASGTRLEYVMTLDVVGKTVALTTNGGPPFTLDLPPGIGAGEGVRASIGLDGATVAPFKNAEMKFDSVKVVRYAP